MTSGRVSKGLWLMLTLAACGGRTIDDGSYDFSGTGRGNSDGSCTYQGVTVASGTLVAEPCLCLCANGQFQCQASCSSTTAGTSAGGASNGGGPITAGAPSSGAPSGGAPSAGAPSAGAPSAGAVGFAGAPAFYCDPPRHAAGKDPMIDDMEDANRFITANEWRSGNWFSYNDDTFGAQQEPSPLTPDAFPMLQTTRPPIGHGPYVAHTSGVGFSSWGAGIGLVLSNGCPYDASVYRGVSFYVQSREPMFIYALFPTAATNPPANGGTCREQDGRACFDAFQAQVFAATVWQRYELDFATLTQQGWGVPARFDAATLIGINFQTSTNQSSFSFDIDDVSFY